MQNIPKSVLEFITSQRVSVLATTLNSDDVHAAAMLFSCNISPFEVYFFTEKNSIKMSNLKDKNVCSASVVVGSSEELKQSVQLDGEITIVSNEEIIKVKKTHYEKFPESVAYESENTVFLKFTPSWWRHTDYNSRPPVIQPK